ncbi:unnamed protein product [marine sediment metagenome]|uniref:Uncharacterized protein n=1 Tax=marine sediment metagenome TaxID=412755 RepID=X1PV65_9ZZZZ
MDSSEEDLPIIKIHLKTYWYVILLLSLLPMIMLVFPLFFLRHEFWYYIIVGSLVTITFILGLLCKNIELIFKIDNADNILIYERFWSKLRIYRRSFKLQDIKRFNVFTRNIPRTQVIDFFAGDYNFLALEFISQKPKYLSYLRDSPFTVDYAQQLNNFLESFTSLNKIDLNSRIIPSKHPSAKKTEENYLKVVIILLFILSFCLLVLLIFWSIAQ